MKNKLAAVLASGGMDSTVAMAIAKNDGYDIAALHLNYGQRTERREQKAFQDIADYYRAATKLIVTVGHFAAIGGSSLTDSALEVSKADLESKDIPTSYVPFRNGNILAIAASWAEVIGAEAIYIGASEVDSSGYPDARDEFLKAFEKAIDLGTKPETKIKIVAPLIKMTKKEIVLKGAELNVPFELTWSCYKNSELACGECDSCALRLRGFQEAGLDDPIPYEKKPFYL